MAAPDILDLSTVSTPSFGLADELAPHTGDWHRHRRHQLLYASAGSLYLEVAGQSWMLPPQRAAWIHGGTEHRVVVKQSASLRTVYLAPELAQGPPGCRVFVVSSLAREMLLAATRWGPAQEAGRAAGCFFTAIGALCSEWAGHAADFRLPRARSSELARAMRETLGRLSDPGLTAPSVARAAGMSARTMARRFQQEAGMSWRSYTHRARMLRAMELLAVPDATVTDTCYQLGFRSLGTFSAAFHSFVGESPSAFRSQLQAR